QFYKKRTFDYAKAADGMRQILLGLFKKIVIADNAATFANEIFNNYGDYSGSTLLLGGVFFAFQIYGDFSGYSDIAIGTARLFGFNLMQNFAYPYFSRDIAEFWRRWHISLSTWFRDYLYIPLGGSRGSTLKKVRNTFAIFIVSGFWHGANWTFIVWGALNAIYFLPLLLLKRNRKNTDLVAQGQWLASPKEFLQMGITFFLTVIAWIFFRSQTVVDAFKYISEIFSSSLFSLPEIKAQNVSAVGYFILLFLFLIVEWLQRDKQHAFMFDNLPIGRVLRAAFYYTIIGAIVWFAGSPQEFIYFQF
ncbi:MAG: MBOAT family O-acyltransferase, partial [Bacteroidota bacterium]|nr:MBOAT family O-acyltransferase [Bacteroidota bacterium]